MRAFFGITMVIIGLIAVLLLGLTKVYSYGSSNSYIAMFLIFGGEVAAIVGAGLAKGYYGRHDFLGKLLFASCFTASAILMIVGLANAFNSQRTGASIYLLIVGFIGALTSASGALN